MLQKNRYLWLLFVSALFQYCTSIDTITQNQSFKDGDVLVSSGNSFAFGFFSPSNFTSNRYVGIWYHTVSEQTVVWVANRDNPINGTTGVLSLDKSGNLVLHDQITNIALWSTDVSGTLNGDSYFVQLMETGNLISCQGTNQNVFWESFRHPTDTLLPHMKQGINRTSGMVWSLTSWKSKDDPGTGDFQLKVSLNGSPQFFLYQNSEKIWRTGPFNGDQLGGVPEMNGEFIFTSLYVDTRDEVSLSFGISNPSVLSRVRVNESGTVDRLILQQGENHWNKIWWGPRDQCDFYGRCGSFSNCDSNGLSQFECECLPGYEPKVESEWLLRIGRNGCVRKPGEPTCGNASVDVKFLQLTSVKVPDAGNTVVNKVMMLKDCRDLCLRICSCTAYARANVSNGGSGCITWYGDLMDMRKYLNNSQDVYLKVSAFEYALYQKNLKKSSVKKLVIVLVPLIVGVILLVLATWLVLWILKGKIQSLRKPLGLNLVSLLPYGGTSRTDVFDEDVDHLPIYDLKDIISATNCFSLANKVGEGGFGSVYKGQLHNGREVAIKRLSKWSGQGTEEFRNEVTLIARLQHRNLVKLLGCCLHQEEKMLVYEYLPNKGLDCFIFGKEHGALLDWRKRFFIILGIARGLVYLHRDSRLRIIHRDLKASNVLLDADLEPKISDFGMARIFNANQMEAITHRVVGTYGYMSPEYAMQGLFSEKSDVFSFGVLLLEIISGRRNTSYFGDNTANLTAYVWELWKDGTSLEIVDPTIGETIDHVEVGRCIQIGLLCVQDHAKERPTMPEVLAMLCNQASVPSASPKQPVFVISKVDPNNNNLPETSSSYLRAAYLDNDEMTITVLQPR